jgi:hypothetical protein
MMGLTHRALMAAALAAPLVIARKASATTSFRFGLTPVLLDSDIALLDQMQVYFAGGAWRIGRFGKAADLSGDHGTSPVR